MMKLIIDKSRYQNIRRSESEAMSRHRETTICSDVMAIMELCKTTAMRH